jgi:hypothetical protein
LLAHPFPWRACGLQIDEAHLLAPGAGNTTSSKVGALSQYKTDHLWLVTGCVMQELQSLHCEPQDEIERALVPRSSSTPFSTSLGQLTNQAKLLGQWSNGMKVRPLAGCMLPPQQSRDLTWPWFCLTGSFWCSWLQLIESADGILKPGKQWPPAPGDEYYSLWRDGHPHYLSAPHHYLRDMSNEMLVERLRKLMIRHTKVVAAPTSVFGASHLPPSSLMGARCVCAGDADRWRSCARAA